MRKVLLFLVVVITAFTIPAVHAEGEPISAEGKLLPDFYEEPGAGSEPEMVDPFSGSLRLSYVDIHLPGNGGMDIDIIRTYTNLQDELGARNVTGAGWNIHFGRVMIAYRPDLCSAHTAADETTINNPIVELPDGSIQHLYYADYEASRYITVNRWKADCTADSSGLLLTSPEGVQYTMDHYVYDSRMVPGTYVNVWYTTKITDRHGNEINISYTTGGAVGEYNLIDQVSSPDGRLVDFSYTDIDTDKVQLTTISAHGQVWTYGYTEIPNNGTKDDWLTTVTRPDGSQIAYTYYPLTLDGSAGSYSLESITYPLGGVSTYTYDYVVFDPLVPDHKTTVVTSKTQSGYEIESGTWTYDYAPGYPLDVTTITTPNAKYVNEYIGAQGAFVEGGDSFLYAIGKPDVESIYDLQGNLVQQTMYQWAPQIISNEVVYRPSRPYMRETHGNAPLLIAKVVLRDGVYHEQRYANEEDYLTKFDRYGNPLSLMETSNYSTRQTDYTYFHETYGTEKWLVNTVKDEIVREAGEVDGVLTDAAILRTFDPQSGDLLQEEKYGATTNFTYFPTGDLNTKTDAREYVTTYENYKRGTPQTEKLPENVTIYRTVNDTGTIASVTDGRGYTTSYHYDGLNRITSVEYPIHSDTSIRYGALFTFTEKTITRGNYQETTKLDGFGRPICIIKKDLQSGISRSSQIRYNAVGQKIFESYPIEAANCGISMPGTTFEYDVLNRLTKIIHTDGDFKTIEYLTGNQIKETNERGFVTYYSYAAFGDPDERYLIRVDAPENITNSISVNKLGQKTGIWQGETNGLGYERTYNYDSRFHLKKVYHPEIGYILYDSDDLGNITSKSYAGLVYTYYGYDGLSRQTSIDYPNDTPDVSFSYDKNNNLISVSNSSSQRAYTYDKNNNLKTEEIAIGTRTWLMKYEYNSLDFASSLSYPSGRQVSYSPNAFGEPTQLAPYINNVTYYPSGQIQKLEYANGQVTDYTLNDRLWVQRMQTSLLTDILDQTYNYDPAGNVSGIIDSIEPNYGITLDYDGADRLSIANGSWGAGLISYDHQGNITNKTIGNVNLNYSYGNGRLASVDGTEPLTYSYDDRGNVTGNDLYTFTYNDANHLIVTAPEVKGMILPSNNGHPFKRLIEPQTPRG